MQMTYKFNRIFTKRLSFGATTGPMCHFDTLYLHHTPFENGGKVARAATELAKYFRTTTTTMK